MRLFTSLTTLLITSCLAFPALGAWQLDSDQSQVSFVTTKKTDIAEVHHFEKLNGTISDNGKVKFVVNLASVNTAIPIRDERMQKFLFETTKFAKASFTTQVDLAFIKAMPAGQQKQLTIEGQLELHGKSQAVKTRVQLVKLTQERILVNALKPVIINAGQYDLAAGVAKLREIANLPSISNAVPLTFSLTFVDK